MGNQLLPYKVVQYYQDLKAGPSATISGGSQIQGNTFKDTVVAEAIGFSRLIGAYCIWYHTENQNEAMDSMLSAETQRNKVTQILIVLCLCMYTHT